MIMRCHRCNGLMASERFYGPGEPFWGWRCLFCGEVLDSLIWENRNHFPKLEKAVKHENGKGERLECDYHDHPGQRRNLEMSSNGEYS